MEKLKKIDLSKGDNSAEDILSFVSYAVLVLGILGSIITGVVYGDFNPEMGYMVAIFGIILCCVIWAVSMILINISTNLRSVKYLLAQNGEGLSNQTEQVPTSDPIKPEPKAKPLDIGFAVGDKVRDEDMKQWDVVEIRDGKIGIARNSWATPKFVNPSEIKKI